MTPVPNQSECSGSPRAPLPSASAGDGRGNHDQRAGHHGLTASEAHDELSDNFANQPRLVLVGRPFAVPFTFVPFHNSEVDHA